MTKPFECCWQTNLKIDILDIEYFAEEKMKWTKDTIKLGHLRHNMESVMKQSFQCK